MDNVNHPSHYTAGVVEVKDFIAALGMNFAYGNVIKYLARAGKKDDYDKAAEDIEKAKYYFNECVDEEQNLKCECFSRRATELEIKWFASEQTSNELHRLLIECVLIHPTFCINGLDPHLRYNHIMASMSNLVKYFKEKDVAKGELNE